MWNEVCGLACEIRGDLVQVFLKKISACWVHVKNPLVRGKCCDLISEIKSEKTSVRGNWCGLISEVK